MGQEEPKGRRAFRKILEDRNEKMRRLLMKMEAEDAKREAKDAAREQRAIREAVEEAKTFREYLEGGHFIHHPAAPDSVTGGHEQSCPQYPPGL